MTKQTVLVHEFVEFIPDELKEGTLYVCMGLATIVHKCCCGCGNEVVTPLSPTDWKLTYDGETITLHPSIGNWGFKCRSHYWIRNNSVRWAAQWSPEEIAAGRAHDRSAKDRDFGTENTPTDRLTISKRRRMGSGKSDRNIWQTVRKWWQDL
jgi:hypothetical protein